MLIELVTVVGVPLARGLAGWLEKALSPHSDMGIKISGIEWKTLLETELRLGFPALALFYGFALPVGWAVAIPVCADYLYHYVGKLIKKLQKK